MRKKIEIPPDLRHDKSLRPGEKSLMTTDGLRRAIKTVFQNRLDFFFCPEIDAELLASQFDSNPDSKIIWDWSCGSDSPQAAFEYVYWIAYFTLGEWHSLPRRTTTEHRQLYGRIFELSNELAALMQVTGIEHSTKEPSGFQRATALNLLTEDEIEAAQATLDSIKGSKAPGLHTMLWTIPNLVTLIGRIGVQAQEIAARGPHHSQPKKKGAMRGFFVRRFAEFMHRGGTTLSTEALAAIASVALQEPTDRELVSKLLRI